jgi:hypothetical protein
MSIFIFDTITIHYILVWNNVILVLKWSVVEWCALDYSEGFVFERDLRGMCPKTLRLEYRKVFCLEGS